MWLHIIFLKILKTIKSLCFVIIKAHDDENFRTFEGIEKTLSFSEYYIIKYMLFITKIL